LTDSDGVPSTLSSETELAVILEGIGEGFYAVDRDWTIRRFNSEAVRHFGRQAQDVLGRTLWETFPGARETPLGQLFLDTMASRQSVVSETASVVVADRWLSYRLFPLGEGMGIVFRDITDRKQAEAQRDMLVQELEHRMKNMLAMVQAIAHQTFRDGKDANARRTFDARLNTLALVQSALTKENWQSASLAELVASTLRPHVAPGVQPFFVSGPDLRVQPKSATALSMALHELCTNAVKYGALSSEGGRVSIEWTIANDRLRLCWRECGGPRVTAPSRTGFGTVMIEQVLAAQLKGDVVIAYESTGLVCTIDAPVAAVQDDL
jgi:PAS domain S-box-containing protein